MKLGSGTGVSMSFVGALKSLPSSWILTALALFAAVLVGALAPSLNPALLVGLGAGVLAVPLVLVYPGLGVIGLLLFQVLLIYPTSGLSSLEILYMMLLLLTVGSWLLRQQHQRPRIPAVMIPAFLTFAFSALSWVQASQNGVALLEWLRGWIRVTNWLLIPVIASEFGTRRRLSVLFWLFVVIAVINAAQATIWIVNASSQDKVWFGNPFEPDTPHSSTLYFWGLIAILTVLIIGHYSKRRTSLLLGALAIFSFRIVADGKRAPVVLGGLAIVLLIGIGFRRGLWRTPVWNLRILAAAAGSIGLAGVFLSYIEGFAFDPLLSRLMRLDTAFAARLSEYEQIVPYIKQAWMWGYGFGYQFPVVTGFGALRSAQYVHNLFLQFWLDGGVLALISLLLVLVVAAQAGRRALAAAKEDLNLHVLATAYALSIPFWIAIASYDTRIRRLEGMLYFAIAVGSFYAIEHVSKLEVGSPSTPDE